MREALAFEIKEDEQKKPLELRTGISPLLRPKEMQSTKLIIIT